MNCENNTWTVQNIKLQAALYVEICNDSMKFKVINDIKYF